MFFNQRWTLTTPPLHLPPGVCPMTSLRSRPTAASDGEKDAARCGRHATVEGGAGCRVSARKMVIEWDFTKKNCIVMDTTMGFWTTYVGIDPYNYVVCVLPLISLVLTQLFCLTWTISPHRGTNNDHPRARMASHCSESRSRSELFFKRDCLPATSPLNTGWCFGTWMDYFSIILGMSESQLTHIFQRGRAQPPTSNSEIMSPWWNWVSCQKLDLLGKIHRFTRMQMIWFICIHMS